MTKSTGREGWARPVLGGRRATSRPREAVQGHGGAGRKLQAVGFDDPAVLRHRPLPAESERPGLTRPPRPAPLRGSLLPLGQARAAPLVCQRQRPEGPRPLPGGRGRGAALPADTASSVPVGEAAEPQARGEAPTTHTPPHQTPPRDPDRQPGRSDRCPPETCHGTGSHKPPPDRPTHRHARTGTHLPARVSPACTSRSPAHTQTGRQPSGGLWFPRKRGHCHGIGITESRGPPTCARRAPQSLPGTQATSGRRPEADEVPSGRKGPQGLRTGPAPQRPVSPRLCPPRS